MAITLEAGVGLGANPIYSFGTEEQRQEWLPDLCAGRALGGFGLTEPEAGSDAGGTRTRAVLDEACRGVGDRRREGVHHELRHARSRAWSPSPPAPTPPGSQPPEISTIIVPAGTRGLRGAAAVPEDGLARVRHARPHLHGLPRARGQPARRPRSRLRQLPRDPRRRAHRDRRARPRHHRGLPRALGGRTRRTGNAFGKPIGSYQAVAFKCADLAVMAATARTLVYEAAWRKDTGRPFKQHAAMAKLYATEGAVTATREATQIFGGYGFMDETPVSPLLPGLQDPRDRRGHERGAAPRDQPRAGPRRRFLTRAARYRRAP